MLSASLNKKFLPCERYNKCIAVHGNNKYVCMHVCMYACIHACMSLCMYVCRPTYVCMYVWMYECMNVCMHVCMCACIHVCMCVCMYVCIHIIIAIKLYKLNIIFLITVKTVNGIAKVINCTCIAGYITRCKFNQLVFANACYSGLVLR